MKSMLQQKDIPDIERIVCIELELKQIYKKMHWTGIETNL